jgi:hypothetical protein
MYEPPEDTRAYFRGRCLAQYASEVVAASWDSVSFDVGRESLVRVPMMEPERSVCVAPDSGVRFNPCICRFDLALVYQTLPTQQVLSLGNDYLLGVVCDCPLVRRERKPAIGNRRADRYNPFHFVFADRLCAVEF